MSAEAAIKCAIAVGRRGMGGGGGGGGNWIDLAIRSAVVNSVLKYATYGRFSELPLMVMEFWCVLYAAQPCNIQGEFTSVL